MLMMNTGIHIHISFHTINEKIMEDAESEISGSHKNRISHINNVHYLEGVLQIKYLVHNIMLKCKYRIIQINSVKLLL